MHADLPLYRLLLTTSPTMSPKWNCMSRCQWKACDIAYLTGTQTQCKPRHHQSKCDDGGTPTYRRSQHQLKIRGAGRVRASDYSGFTKHNSTQYNCDSHLNRDTMLYMSSKNFTNILRIRDTERYLLYTRLYSRVNLHSKGSHDLKGGFSLG